tara:strand:+ start:646 stop:852 length:207 start_codon:yes stop_codon:yes gene_type:complete
MPNHYAEEYAKYDNIKNQQETRRHRENVQLDLFSEKEWGDILFQKEMKIRDISDSMIKSWDQQFPETD